MVWTSEDDGGMIEGRVMKGDVVMKGWGRGHEEYGCVPPPVSASG